MKKLVQLKNLLIEFESVSEEIGGINCKLLDDDGSDQISDRLCYLKNIKEQVLREIFDLFED